MTDSAGELNLGLLLFIPYRALENRVFAALAAAGFEDFTTAQARIFQRIGPNGTRLTELAQAAQVTKQTAGFLVDQLERAGYVERVVDPADGRARLVRITPPRRPNHSDRRRRDRRPGSGMGRAPGTETNGAAAKNPVGAAGNHRSLPVIG